MSVSDGKHFYIQFNTTQGDKGLVEAIDHIVRQEAVNYRSKLLKRSAKAKLYKSLAAHLSEKIDENYTSRGASWSGRWAPRSRWVPEADKLTAGRPNSLGLKTGATYRSLVEPAGTPGAIRELDPSGPMEYGTKLDSGFFFHHGHRYVFRDSGHSGTVPARPFWPDPESARFLGPDTQQVITDWAIAVLGNENVVAARTRTAAVRKANRDGGKKSASTMQRENAQIYKVGAGEHNSPTHGQIGGDGVSIDHIRNYKESRTRKSDVDDFPDAVGSSDGHGDDHVKREVGDRYKAQRAEAYATWRMPAPSRQLRRPPTVPVKQGRFMRYTSRKYTASPGLTRQKKPRR